MTHASMEAVVATNRSMDSREFVARVIDALNVAMAEDATLHLADIANDLGYALNTMQQFRAGTFRSVRVATQVAEVFPAWVADLRCECCGSLPALVFDRRRS